MVGQGWEICMHCLALPTTQGLKVWDRCSPGGSQGATSMPEGVEGIRMLGHTSSMQESVGKRFWPLALRELVLPHSPTFRDQFPLLV